jgi:hypothetical protein
MRFLDMVRRIDRDRHLVEPHQRAFLRDDVFDDLDAVVGLGGAVARLQHVAGPADRQADVAVGQRVDVFRRVELRM